MPLPWKKKGGGLANKLIINTEEIKRQLWGKNCINTLTSAGDSDKETKLKKGEMVDPSRQLSAIW